MPAVSDIEGKILPHETTLFSSVAKGYTRFRDGDVIFAKITPCMENGKIAIAKHLHGGMACGSTEFHVLRAGKEVLAEYIWRFLRQNGYRSLAAQHMTGAVGQRRVPVEFLKKSILPLPPLQEQRRIITKLDSLLGCSKNARDELDHIPKLVARYKRAVLTSAFCGDLTADWRRETADASDSSEFLRRRAGVAASRRTASAYRRDERSALIERDPELSDALGTIADADNLPATWKWCGVGEVFGVYVGATPSRKEDTYWHGNIPWVSSGEVAFCRITNTAEAISEAGLRDTSTRMHPRGTVLLGMIGEGKTRGQAAILDIEACNNQNCAAIRVSEAGYPPEYVYWYLYAVYEQTRTAGAGNNQPALNKDRVHRLGGIIRSRV
jgi:type I restriction enzyme, S subunit